MTKFVLDRPLSEHHYRHENGEVIPQESYLPGDWKNICFNNDVEKECYSIFKKLIAENQLEHRITTSYFVGLDWLKEKELAIYVEPKLNSGKLQTNYLQMLFSALKHSSILKHTNELTELYEIKWDTSLIMIKQEHDILTPLLIVQFLNILKEIVRKGLKMSYYKVERNLYGRIKGKVMVGATIKKNILRNKTLNTWCSYDEFGFNSIENRLLKKALVFVQRYLPSYPHLKAEQFITESLNYIMPAFEMVTEDVNINDIIHSKVNLFYKEYKEGLRLAKLILRRFGYNMANTSLKSIPTPPFWIDMSKLFELYVLGQLMDAYPNNIVYQFSSVSGKPDYLLLKEGEKKVIDAKYKTRYQAQHLLYDDYLIKDFRQLSGYSRDRKVLVRLGYSVSELMEPECLIIYPDQTSSEKLMENPSQEILEFTNFKKKSIRLPELPVKSILPTQRV